MRSTHEVHHESNKVMVTTGGITHQARTTVSLLLLLLLFQQAWYCNATCQQAGWRVHKHTCKQLRLAAALHQAEQHLRQELGLQEQQQQQEQQQAAAAAEFGLSFTAFPTAAELAAAVLKPEQVGGGVYCYCRQRATAVCFLNRTIWLQ
jgi:hypothetical protein